MTVVSTTPSAYAKEGFGAYEGAEVSSNLRLVSGAANGGTGDINLRAYVLGTGQVLLEWDTHSTSNNPSTGLPYNTLIIELQVYDSSGPTNLLFTNITFPDDVATNRIIDAASTSYITEVNDTTASFFSTRSVSDPQGGFTKPFTGFLVIYQGQDGEAAPVSQSGIWSSGVFDFALTNDIDLGYVDATTGRKAAASYAGSTFTPSTSNGIYAAKSFANYNLNVPQGARIVSAKLKMQAAGSGGTPIVSPKKVVTYAEDIDNSSAPTATTRAAFGDYIDGLTKTVEVDNEKAGWGAGTQVFFDCTAAVQEVVDRTGWVANNGITIFTEMRPTDGTSLTYPRNNDDEIDTFEDLSVYLGYTGYFLGDPELEVEYGVAGVGSSDGTSTVTGTITNGIAAQANGFSSAIGFSSFTVPSSGAASGSSSASAVGGAGVDATAASNGVATSDFVSGEGREASSTASSTASATSESGTSADGSASGSSSVSASSEVGSSSQATASGSSSANAIGSLNATTDGSSNGSSSVNGQSRLLNSQPGSASGSSAASGIGSSQAAAAGSSAGSSTVSSVGEQGSGGDGSASGSATSAATGESLAASVAASSGTSTNAGQGASQNKQAGTAAGQSIAIGVGASEARSIFESLAFSTAEARYPTRQQTFFKDLSQRVSVTGVRHQAARLIELDGGKIIEPTAFEPDAATYRDTHYYNAKTNTLYVKVITRNEPGIIVAHWQKVSQ
ncbi:MAG: hypothetical protein ACXADH_00075 [Candidatus Kariarchaeaceae archaeon]|jgi:hypothetical protein